MISQNDYYKQASVWGKNIENYQYQVLIDILDMIPNDVNSILDVGCGDGHITNFLPKNIKVVGMDISESALKHVNKEKVIGDITKMPFEDNSFDLVMANDILEHINDIDHQKALNELQRVAKKYILITVPNNEDIESKKIECKQCGNKYHINWHQRRYNEQYMKKIGEQERWDIYEIRYSGANSLPPLDLTIPLKHEMGFFYNWQNCICSICGSKEYLQSEGEEKILRIIDSIRHNMWYSEKEPSIITDRSEIISLYRLEKEDRNKIITKGLENPKVFESNLLDIDFGNRLQQVNDDFISGSNWSRFKLRNGKILNNEGICSIDKEKEMEIEIKLPVVPQTEDKIIVNLVKNHNKGGRIVLYTLDGISGIQNILYEKSIEEDALYLEVPIKYIWTADKFGLAINIYIYGGIALQGIKYVKKNNKNRETYFLQVYKGHNKVSLENNNYLRTFGIYSEHEGVIPIYRVFQQYEAENEKNQNKFIDKYLLETTNFSISFLKEKLHVIESLLESKEISRNHIENSYSRLQFMMEDVQNQLNKTLKVLQEKELERDHVEKLYSEASKYATYWNKSRSRKVNRVLVISHMFPSNENQINGSFVHEQVKSLIINEGIDVRVISCKPFWMNGFNMRNLWSANNFYKQSIINKEWEQYDNVPVLYLPYRVGVPFIPFHFHSWTYTDAIMRAIDRVWKEFKFDMIHAHTSYLDGNAALTVSKKYNVPYIITEHTGPFSILTEKPIVKQRTLNAIKQSNRVLAVSNSLEKEIKDYFNESEDLSHIGVLYNGVSTDRFNTGNHLKNKTEKIQIIYVGYLEEVKNPINLIQAFSIVLEKLPNVELKIVGDGTLRTKVEEEIKRLNIQDHVNILGLKTREEVAKLMQEQCDVFVLPSISETFGVVLIEALASGKPVVATKCGGPESIIKEDYVGELCKNNDHQALGESIIKVVMNLDKYDSKKIRQYAIDNFDFRCISSKLIQVYENI